MTTLPISESKSGRIATISKDKISGKETVDAKSLVVVQGFIDTHFHAIDPFATKMFVGSMNLDQRSLHINNEIGILFHNPDIAGQSAEAFDRNIEKVAFTLEFNTAKNGSESVRWQLRKDDGEVVYNSEPFVGFWKKFGVELIRLLPVESLL